jgi:hypothetical protein
VDVVVFMAAVVAVAVLVHKDQELEEQSVLFGPGIHARSHQPMLALMSHQHQQLVQ